MFSFLAILLNCTNRAITGRIACVQFNSTLERKVKTKALKGFFWYVIKAKFCALSLASSKNFSFLSSFGLRVVFVKGS